MTLAGVATTQPMPVSTAVASTLTTGPDGALWFGESPGGRVGRMGADGAIQEWPIPGDPGTFALVYPPYPITSGVDRALWFADPSVGIVRIRTDGTITPFPISTYRKFQVVPHGVAAGPDGNLWFTLGPDTIGQDNADSWIGRMAPTGAVNLYPLPLDASIGGPTGITTGPDGMLWFGDQGVIGRLDPSVAAPAQPAPTPSPTTTSPPATQGGGGAIAVPNTGGAANAWLGLCLVAAGAVALLVALRRRRRDTSR
jgi:virginiamycin B lyase